MTTNTAIASTAPLVEEEDPRGSLLGGLSLKVCPTSLPADVLVYEGRGGLWIDRDSRLIRPGSVGPTSTQRYQRLAVIAGELFGDMVRFRTEMNDSTPYTA